jgi:hypothetical protein
MTPSYFIFAISRGGRTRTADPRVPNAVRYRTALHPGAGEYTVYPQHGQVELRTVELRMPFRARLSTRWLYRFPA